MWEEGGTEVDRVLTANVSFLDLPKSRYRFRCLQLHSEEGQPLCCGRRRLRVPGLRLVLCCVVEAMGKE